MEFSEWITKKYIQWRGDAIRGHAISNFAAYIGVPQSVLSSWMQPNGKQPTSRKSINRLVNCFGEEVYEILGLPTPGEENLISVLPPQRAESLRRALIEVNDALKKAGTIPEEEASRIADKVMEKHGWRSKDT
jgi:hypothetical protein